MWDNFNFYLILIRIDKPGTKTANDLDFVSHFIISTSLSDMVKLVWNELITPVFHFSLRPSSDTTDLANGCQLWWPPIHNHQLMNGPVMRTNSKNISFDKAKPISGPTCKKGGGRRDTHHVNTNWFTILSYYLNKRSRLISLQDRMIEKWWQGRNWSVTNTFWILGQRSNSQNVTWYIIFWS